MEMQSPRPAKCASLDSDSGRRVGSWWDDGALRDEGRHRIGLLGAGSCLCRCRAVHLDPARPGVARIQPLLFETAFAVSVPGREWSRARRGRGDLGLWAPPGRWKSSLWHQLRSIPPFTCALGLEHMPEYGRGRGRGMPWRAPTRTSRIGTSTGWVSTPMRDRGPDEKRRAQRRRFLRRYYPR
jgi:hypothetical protein